MAQQPSEIEHQIEQQRQHLAQHLSELQFKVGETTDHYTYVLSKRAMIAALALGTCVVLAILVFRK